MTRSVADYKVLTLDCYGTLIDWETGLWDALQPVIMENGRDDLIRRDTLVAFAETESDLLAKTPDILYPMLLSQVHRALADRLGLKTSDALDRAFGESLPTWPAFADTADALRRLKKRYKLVILSNVNRAGFAAANRKLGIEFDAIHTAEDIGCYKPNPANFEYLLSHLETDFALGVEDVLHTAQSLFHDHSPATGFGLAKCWIDRQALSRCENWGATRKVENRPDVDFLYFSLSEMADAVECAG